MLAYGIYARVVDVSEIKRESAANKWDFWYNFSLLFWRLSSIFFIKGGVFCIKIQNYFNPISLRDVFHFSAIKTLLYGSFSLNVCEATRKARAIQAASAYKRREFWRRTHTPLWLFSHTCKKHLSRFRLGVSFFFTSEKHRSLFWLARTHLSMKVFTSLVFSE